MIKFENVNFSYNQGEGHHLIENLNLTINQGEFVLLCGSSGSGKTTLTRMINGLIPHYYQGNLGGNVTVDGKVIEKCPLYELATTVGSVFQNPKSQFFNLDATSELIFGCENIGMPIVKIEERLTSTVQSLSLHHLLNRNLFHLSGGEKQRVACGSVATLDPPIMVLDEPSSNLDFKATNDLKALLSIWKKQGKTVVIAEHRLYYLKDLVDRVIYFEEGQIKKELSGDDFRKLTKDQLNELGLRVLRIEDIDLSLNQTHETKTIEINHLTFGYNRNNPVLNIESLALPMHCITAVIGANGAGKSTFARCLCGLEKKTKGKIQLDNQLINNKERLKKCFMVMQDVNHQLFAESSLDEVLISMPTEDEGLAEEILESLNLIKEKENHPMALSGGQKQRLAIATAIASECEIIIFDEPTSGLDLEHMKKVADNIELLKQFGKTVIVVTHDPELIMSCCDHILHMENGRVEASYPLNKDNHVRLIQFFKQQMQI